MKNRRAIIFFTLASAVLSAVLVLISVFGKRDMKPAISSLSAMDAGDVVRVDVLRRIKLLKDERRETFSIVREDGKWLIKEPVSAEADEESVKQLVDTVVFSEPRDALSEADMAALGRSLRDFGLESPICEVSIWSGNGGETFLIGNRTAAGDEVYVSRKNRNGVFAVPLRLLDETMRPFVDFRRRRLFTFHGSHVVGIGLKDAGEPLKRLGKRDGGWRIVNPNDLDFPADLKTTEKLIDELCSAQVLKYMPDAPSGHGLGDGEGFSVSLRDSFGAVEKVILGDSCDSNLIWAVTSEGAVVHVNRNVLDMCRSRLKTLEDTSIFPVEASSVLSFSMSRKSSAYVVSRSGRTAPWSLVSPVDVAADGATAENVLGRILSLSGSELADEGVSDAVLVSVDTAVTNFSARYVSGGKLMKDFDFVDLIGKTMIRCPRQSVERILIKTADSEKNAISSGEVLDLLENGIRAERVECVCLGPGDFERCGFMHPSCTISIKLSDGASSMKRMLIGSAAPGGGRYSMIGGLDAAFVLSDEIVSILEKSGDSSVEVMK